VTRPTVRWFSAQHHSYGYPIHDPGTGVTTYVDTPDARAITRQLEENALRLSPILIACHDWDPVGGTRRLGKEYGRKHPLELVARTARARAASVSCADTRLSNHRALPCASGGDD
jgi:hypothetical protein